MTLSLPSKLLTKIFLVFAMFMFVVPQLGIGVTHAQATQGRNGTTWGEPNTATAATEGLNCGVVTGYIIDCVAVMTYYVLYIPASYLLLLAGLFFDAMTAFTLSSEVLGGSDLVATGWNIVRDIANSVFLFILIYIAIATILQINSSGTKRMLASLIIIAFLMNFSLFFTRVVVDASNVVAVTIYEKMGTVKVAGSGLDSPITTNISVQERALSATFVGGFAPQSFFSPTTFQALQSASENRSTNTALMIFLFIIAAVINVIAAWAITVAGFLFLGRVVALWLIMILSPLAFAAYIIPKTKGTITDKWWAQLINQAFLAPVFLFFVYLILLAIKLNMFSVSFADGFGFLQGLIYIIMQFSILTTFLIVAVKLAKKMSGEAGQHALKFGKVVGGVAGGVALGGAAIAARNTAGFAAKRVADSKAAQKISEVSPRLGKFAVQSVDRVAKSSFDVRNTQSGMMAQRNMGVTFGQGGGQGGYSAALDAKTTEKMKFAETIKNPELKAKYLEKIGRERSVLTGGYTTTQAAQELGKRKDFHDARMKNMDDGEKAAYITTDIKDTDMQRAIYESMGAIPRTRLSQAAEMRNDKNAMKRLGELEKGLGAVDRGAGEDFAEGRVKTEKNTLEGLDMERIEKDAAGNVVKKVNEQLDYFASIPAELQAKVYKELSAKTREGLHKKAPTTATKAGQITQSDLQKLKETLSNEEAKKVDKALGGIAKDDSTDKLVNDIKTKLTGGETAASIPDIATSLKSFKGIDDDVIDKLEPLFTEPKVTQYFTPRILDKMSKKKDALSEKQAEDIRDSILKRIADTKNSGKDLSEDEDALINYFNSPAGKIAWKTKTLSGNEASAKKKADAEAKKKKDDAKRKADERTTRDADSL